MVATKAKKTKVETPKTIKMQMLVWTSHYHPFTMGGNLWWDVGAIVPVDGPHELGRKYKGYLVTAPNGRTFVVEAMSGAFVGPDLESVRSDIKTGSIKLMNRQVTDACRRRRSVKQVPATEFWEALKCNVKVLSESAV